MFKNPTAQHGFAEPIVLIEKIEKWRSVIMVDDKSIKRLSLESSKEGTTHTCNNHTELDKVVKDIAARNQKTEDLARRIFGAGKSILLEVVTIAKK